MTLDELITHLRERKIHIFDDGIALKLQAPRGVITPQLLEEVTLYSADIQYLVRLGDARVCPDRWEHTFICRACRKETAAYYIHFLNILCEHQR